MEVIFHSHAESKLLSRQIPREIVMEAVSNPQERVPGHSGRWVYQSRFFDTVHAEELLLRVVVEESDEELLILAIYKTSKIDKYWQGGLQA